MIVIWGVWLLRSTIAAAMPALSKMDLQRAATGVNTSVTIASATLGIID